MKTLNKIFFGFFLATLITGCGRENGKVVGSQVMKRGISTRSSCPLKFSKSGLCGEIKWIAGPSADKESSFYVTFWDEKTGSAQGPFTEPTAQVGSFIRMTCCGSIFFSTVNKSESGKYLVSKVKFTPGKWEVYVQLKTGNEIEKQFITVNLDD